MGAAQIVLLEVYVCDRKVSSLVSNLRKDRFPSDSPCARRTFKGLKRLP